MSKPPGSRSSKRLQTPAELFEIVKTVGLALPNVEATIKYDGSPVLKLGGCFMAGMATHRSAEPGTLVVRFGFEERELLIEDTPATYYLTDYYRSYPLVLVRLSRVNHEALRDLLSVSWNLTSAKARPISPPEYFEPDPLSSPSEWAVRSQQPRHKREGRQREPLSKGRSR